MLFLLPAFYKAAALDTPDVVPVDQDTINALNGALLNDIIPKLNAGFSTQIKKAGLDPWESVAKGNYTSNVDLGDLCRGSVTFFYGLTNLHGLSSILIDGVKITSANVSADGATSYFAVEGGIRPLNFITDVAAGLELHCGGTFDPRIGLDGSINGTGISFHVQVGSSTVESTNQGLLLKAAHIVGLSIDYDKVYVNLKGIEGILNPLLDKYLPELEQTYKSYITRFVTELILPQLDPLIAKFLPFTIPVNFASPNLRLTNKIRF